jgi:hypothetical protein
MKREEEEEMMGSEGPRAHFIAQLQQPLKAGWSRASPGRNRENRTLSHDELAKARVVMPSSLKLPLVNKYAVVCLIVLSWPRRLCLSTDKNSRLDHSVDRILTMIGY